MEEKICENKKFKYYDESYTGNCAGENCIGDPAVMYCEQYREIHRKIYSGEKRIRIWMN